MRSFLKIIFLFFLIQKEIKHLGAKADTAGFKADNVCQVDLP
jgi:hypothetical protein